MVSSKTEGIQVSVTTEYQKEYSSPEKSAFVFTYRITIENKSEYTIQLLRRHWYIHDAAFPVKEVEGEGVVGKMPVLEPGEVHSYVSGCNLQSGFGKMYGTYLIERIVDGKKLNISIPEFTLIAPFLNN